MLLTALVCAFASSAAAQEPARMFQGLGPQFVVFRDAVQAQLKLSNEQKQKLEERLQGIMHEHMEWHQKIEGLKDEDRQKEFAAYQKQAQEKISIFLKETLSEQQVRRLRQIVLQRDGLLTALARPQVMSELNITDDQKQQIMNLMQEMHKTTEPLRKEAQSGGNPQEIGPRMAKIRKEYDGKVLAVLNDAQKKGWQEMLGEPFKLDD
ncbi:MAG: hypothetical protein ACT4QC_09135 [Planctomycetaceae bacterium]